MAGPSSRAPSSIFSGMRLLVAAAAAACMCAAASGCFSAADCSFGGSCVAGACVCRAEWSGPNCSQLALAPAMSGVAYHPTKTSSWGGSVVAAHGAYWMAVAEMLHSCGLQSWESNSAIRLARADAAQGPFIRGPLLLSAFAHNPTMHKTANGSLVIAHIGQGVAEHPLITNCTNGTTPGAPGTAPAAEPAPAPAAAPLRLGIPGTALPPPNFLVLASGDPADGSAWAAVNSSGGAWAANNPSLLLHEDDSALLVYKASCALPCPGGCFCRQFGVATAPHWSGPFTDQGLIAVYGEDAYAWRDAAADGGAYHMLFQGGSYAPEYPTYVGHWHTAFSADGLAWTVAADSTVFDASIALASGGALELGRRERHQLLFNETTRAPSHLYNGVNLASAIDDGTFTAVQPIGRV